MIKTVSHMTYTHRKK